MQKFKNYDAELKYGKSIITDDTGTLNWQLTSILSLAHEQIGLQLQGMDASVTDDFDGHNSDAAYKIWQNKKKANELVKELIDTCNSACYDY